MSRNFEVLQPGMLTLVQDLGRYGYQEFGVPVAGSMDSLSTMVANILVGNPRNFAVLEMMLIGPTIKFDSDVSIAITGGNLSPEINGNAIPMWMTLQVKQGDILSFKGLKSGIRSYLAIDGGIDTPIIMNSRSTYTKASLGGFEGRALKKGDIVAIGVNDIKCTGKVFHEDLIPNYPNRITCRVILGPQENRFTSVGIQTFLSNEYVVTNECDRMGYRLEGDVIEHTSGGDIISDGITFGAIQVPSHGMPIIMMADRQTTGGYTKIAGVIAVDLPKLAQAKPGDTIRFKTISIEDAHKLLRDQEIFLKSLEEQSSQIARLFRVNVAGTVYDVRVEERY